MERLKGKTIVTGFHGIGFVGFIAVDFMVRKLNTEKVGWHFNSQLPAVVFAGKDKMEMPIEFHVGKKINFMKFSVMAEREVLNETVKETVEMLKKAGAKELVVIGGLTLRGAEGAYGLANEKGRGLMKKLKLKQLETEITVFGPMASALIHGESLGLPVVCMLQPASSRLPDPNAASNAIKHLSEVFGFKLDTQDLEKDAKKIEKRIKELESKDDGLADRMFV